MGLNGLDQEFRQRKEKKENGEKYHSQHLMGSMIMFKLHLMMFKLHLLIGSIALSKDA